MSSINATSMESFFLVFVSGFSGIFSSCSKTLFNYVISSDIPRTSTPIAAHPSDNIRMLPGISVLCSSLSSSSLSFFSSLLGSI